MVTLYIKSKNDWFNGQEKEFPNFFHEVTIFEKSQVPNTQMDIWQKNNTFLKEITKI